MEVETHSNGKYSTPGLVFGTFHLDVPPLLRKSDADSTTGASFHIGIK